MKKNSFRLRTVDKLSPVPKEVVEDYRWADQHHAELAKKYPEKWVAIINKKVVSSGTRPDYVLAKAYRFIRRPDIALHFVEGRLHLY
jgi:hypothetical protein